MVLVTLHVLQEPWVFRLLFVHFFSSLQNTGEEYWVGKREKLAFEKRSFHSLDKTSYMHIHTCTYVYFLGWVCHPVLHMSNCPKTSLLVVCNPTTCVLWYIIHVHYWSTCTSWHVHVPLVWWLVSRSGRRQKKRDWPAVLTPPSLQDTLSCLRRRDSTHWTFSNNVSLTTCVLYFVLWGGTWG